MPTLPATAQETETQIPARIYLRVLGREILCPSYALALREARQYEAHGHSVEIVQIVTETLYRTPGEGKT